MKKYIVLLGPLLLCVTLLFLPAHANAYTIIPGLLGSDITDPENDIVDNQGDLAGGNASSGANFNWSSSNASSKNFFGNPGGAPQSGALDIFDNLIGPAGGANRKWETGTNGLPAFVELSFDDAYFLTHFTITSSDSNNGRRPDIWTIDGSNDGSTWTNIYSYSNDGTSPFTAGNAGRNETLRFNGGSDFTTQVTSYDWFRYRVTSVENSNSTRHQLAELELFGRKDTSSNPIPEPASMLLFGSGLIGLAGFRRRFKKS